MSSQDVARHLVTTSEHLAGRMWRDVLRAQHLLRAGVAEVDRVLDHSNGSDADPLVWIALTEASQAAYRALVKLTEVRDTLADPPAEHASQRPMSEEITAEALRRREAR